MAARPSGGMPGSGVPGPGGGAQFGFDEAEDEQRDADDGDEGGDAVVVVQEDRADFEGLLQVAVPLSGDPLVFAGLQHVSGGQRRLAAADLGDARVDLLPGLAVAAAEPVADAGQGRFGRGQGTVAGCGFRAAIVASS
jgi:hypothetical protein